MIDTTNVPTGYTAAMYVTSFCRKHNVSTQQDTDSWYLHEIDLSTGLDLCAGGSYNSSNQCGSGGTPQRVQVSSSSDSVSVSCSALAGGCSSGSMPFAANEQNQRPALLEVQNSTLTPNHLIYVAFGAFANSLRTPNVTFHGWLLSYTTDSQGYLSRPTTSGSKLQFNASTKGSYAPGNTDQPPCDATVYNDIYGNAFQDAPNLCGYLATFWSSTRGLTSTSYNDLSDNAFDMFFTAGDGPFQYKDANGNVLSAGYNFGNSLLRFQHSSLNGMGLTPHQVFTPAGQQQFQWPQGGSFTQNCGPITSLSPAGYTYTPCTPAIQPSQLNTRCADGCPSGTSGSQSCPCKYTFDVLNSNDQDMGTSGQILFKNASGNWLLTTTDKAGYGYLLKPSDLCNGSGCTGTYSGGGANTTYSFSQGDIGNLFPFTAAKVVCQNAPANSTHPGMTEQADCDRTTSMAFYDGRLYLWPNNVGATNGERLTALQLSDWSTTTAFTGTISSWTQNLSGAGDGSNDGQTQVVGSGTLFTEQVLAGDQIAACSCTAPNCPVITKVTDNTHLTLSKLPSCTPGSGSVSYAGYFINPAYDISPPPGITGYPGGSLVIDSSSPSSGDGVVFAVSDADNAGCNCSGGTCSSLCDSNSNTRSPGVLYAYDAAPNSNSALPQLWNTAPYDVTGNPHGCTTGTSGNCPQTFCASSFALPTVANGRVYLPVYAINNDGHTYCPDNAPSNSYLSGIPVYAKN